MATNLYKLENLEKVLEDNIWLSGNDNPTQADNRAFQALKDEKVSP